MTNESIPSSILDTIALGYAEPAPAEPVPTPAIDSAIELTLAEREDNARQRATGLGGVLERIIDDGQRKARDVTHRVMADIPTDYLVPAKAVRWGVNKDQGRVVATVNGGPMPVHSHAFGQMATRYQVPRAYADRLVSGEEWQNELGQLTLNDHAEHDLGRMLVRTCQGQIRAFLSDRYRRLDSRPLLDAFLGAIGNSNLVVYSGRATDVKIVMRALVPQVFDIEGDPNLIGLEWSNSDYGAGAHNVRVFALRCTCLNGQTGASVMKNVHLGRKLGGDDAGLLSAKTHDLDSQAMASALTDVVTGFADKIDGTVERIRTAARQRLDLGGGAPAAIKKALSKDEWNRAKDLYESSEAVMLPPAPTVHRFVNVLGWMANTTASESRALEYERLAGQMSGI